MRARSINVPSYDCGEEDGVQPGFAAHSVLIAARAFSPAISILSPGVTQRTMRSSALY